MTFEEFQKSLKTYDTLKDANIGCGFAEDEDCYDIHEDTVQWLVYGYSFWIVKTSENVYYTEFYMNCFENESLEVVEKWLFNEVLEDGMFED